MDQLNQRNKGKELLKAFAAVIAVNVIMRLFGHFALGSVDSYFLRLFLNQFVFAGSAVAALLVLKEKGVLEFKITGFGRGLKAGVLLIAPILVWTGKFVLGLLNGGTGNITAGAGDIVLFILYVLLIGVAEEVLYRGILQNAFHKVIGENSENQVWMAITVSGFLFGMVHLTNILAGITLKSVIIQSVAVIPVGIILGYVYYKSGKNLWVCVLLHSLYDALQFLNKGILGGVTTGSMMNSYAGYSMLHLVPVLAALAALAGVLVLTGTRDHMQEQYFNLNN